MYYLITVLSDQSHVEDPVSELLIPHLSSQTLKFKTQHLFWILFLKFKKDQILKSTMWEQITLILKYSDVLSQTLRYLDRLSQTSAFNEMQTPSIFKDATQLFKTQVSLMCSLFPIVQFSSSKWTISKSPTLSSQTSTTQSSIANIAPILKWTLQSLQMHFREC